MQRAACNLPLAQRNVQLAQLVPRATLAAPEGGRRPPWSLQAPRRKRSPAAAAVRKGIVAGTMNARLDLTRYGWVLPLGGRPGNRVDSLLVKIRRKSVTDSRTDIVAVESSGTAPAVSTAPPLRGAEEPRWQSRVHWNVFGFTVLEQMMECMGLVVEATALVHPYHIMVLGRKPPIKLFEEFPRRARSRPATGQLIEAAAPRSARASAPARPRRRAP